MRYGGKVSPERLTAPDASSAITPASATAIENTQARMRPVSPMLTQSETAPMAQKLVLLVTAPMMTAAANTATSTSVCIVNGMALV